MHWIVLPNKMVLGPRNTWSPFCLSWHPSAICQGVQPGDVEDVNGEEVNIFCVHLTEQDMLLSYESIKKDTNIMKSSTTVHDSLAMAVCNEILSSPNNNHNNHKYENLLTDFKQNYKKLSPDEIKNIFLNLGWKNERFIMTEHPWLIYQPYFLLKCSIHW